MVEVDDTSVAVWLTQWKLEEVGESVRLGDVVSWTVSVMDSQWVETIFDGTRQVTREVDHYRESDSSTEPLTGRVISLEAVMPYYGRNGEPLRGLTQVEKVEATDALDDVSRSAAVSASVAIVQSQ